jgi:DNA-binding NtrC family response regulator
VLALASPRLIIIDDEAPLRRLYTRILRHHFVVECAEDVESAIERIERGAIFDAILCDLNLPRLKGHHLHAHLERHHPGMADRLVIITGEEPSVRDPFTKKLLASERYLAKTAPTAELTATMLRIAKLRITPER